MQYYSNLTFFHFKERAILHPEVLEKHMGVDVDFEYEGGVIRYEMDGASAEVSSTHETHTSLIVIDTGLKLTEEAIVAAFETAFGTQFKSELDEQFYKRDTTT